MRFPDSTSFCCDDCLQIASQLLNSETLKCGKKRTMTRCHNIFYPPVLIGFFWWFLYSQNFFKTEALLSFMFRISKLKNQLSRIKANLQKKFLYQFFKGLLTLCTIPNNAERCSSQVLIGKCDHFQCRTVPNQQIISLFYLRNVIVNNGENYDRQRTITWSIIHADALSKYQVQNDLLNQYLWFPNDIRKVIAEAFHNLSKENVPEVSHKKY